MRQRQWVGFGAAAVAALSIIYVACVGDSGDTNIEIVADAGPSADGTNASDGASLTDSGSLAPDAAPSLGCPLGCLPPAPSGWTGPSAVYNGASSGKPTACPSMYTQMELAAFQGLSAPASVCVCDTYAVQGATCTAFVGVYSGDSNCNTGADLVLQTAQFVVPSANGCITTQQSGAIRVTSINPDAGTCVYGPSKNDTYADASFTAEQISCGLPENAACATSSVCVATPIPDAPFTQLCIHQNGDVKCPSADYAQRFLAYENIVDTRACSTCTGTPSITCGTSWGTTTNSLSDCTKTPPTGLTATAGCATGDNTAGLSVGGPIGPTNQICTTNGGGQPDGGTTAANPVTFCCNK